MCEFSAFFQNKSDSKCCLVDISESKNTKLWTFSIEFGELRNKNVTNTFIQKQDFAYKDSQ